jgi:hypothetical protein
MTDCTIDSADNFYVCAGSVEEGYCCCCVASSLLLDGQTPLSQTLLTEFPCGRFSLAHAESLNGLVSHFLKLLFEGGGEGSGAPSGFNPPPIEHRPLVTLRSLPILSASGLLTTLTCSRLAYLMKVSERSAEPRRDPAGELAEEDEEESQVDANHHNTMYNFGVPHNEEGMLVVPLAVWTRLLLRAFQSVTSSAFFTTTDSCCLHAFVDGLGTSSFLHLVTLMQSDSLGAALKDAHLLFFGLQYWNTLKPETPLNRTCSFATSLQWSALAAATAQAWVPRALPDHAVLVAVLLQLLRNAGVSDLVAAGVVASIARHPVTVLGLNAEVYSVKVPQSVHEALSAVVYDATGGTDSTPHPQEPQRHYIYFVEFCRMWIDWPTEATPRLPHRHEYAVAKQRWLCSVMSSAGCTGSDTPKPIPLSFDLAVPIRTFRNRNSFLPPYSQFRAFRGENVTQPPRQWTPCFLSPRMTREIGNRVQFTDWENEAVTLVTGLWGTTDWTQRLSLVKKATTRLAELVASMNEAEVQRCGFALAAETTPPFGDCTMTHMPNVMWQVRLPNVRKEVTLPQGDGSTIQVAVGNVLGVRVHVFEDSAETVPHNHGIPFFSSIVRGGYVQVMWREVGHRGQSSTEQVELSGQPWALPPPQPSKKPQLPAQLGVLKGRSENDSSPSASQGKDQFSFVAVRRPFVSGPRVKPVETDEHGASTSSAPSSDRSGGGGGGGVSVVGKYNLEKSFFHTHRAGAVYFIGPHWIHTVDASSSSHPSTIAPTLSKSKTFASQTSSASSAKPPQKTISFVFRLPTYFDATNAATFYIPEDCICPTTSQPFQCKCACLRKKGGDVASSQLVESDDEVAIERAALAAVRGTYGISKEGSAEAAAVMADCREACRSFLIRQLQGSSC